MKTIRTLAVLAAAMTMTVSSWGGLIGFTAQGGSPAGELTKLLTLIDPDEDCTLSFIGKNETVGALKVKTHTYPNLDFLGSLDAYDTIFVGVKAATQIAWYEYATDSLPLTYTSNGILNPGGKTPDISHITFFGLSCPDNPPGVPDAGSMLVMLGAGMASLAGLSRKLRR